MEIIREAEKYFAIPKNLQKYIVSLLRRKWELHPCTENNEINVTRGNRYIFSAES